MLPIRLPLRAAARHLPPVMRRPNSMMSPFFAMPAGAAIGVRFKSSIVTEIQSITKPISNMDPTELAALTEPDGFTEVATVLPDTIGYFHSLGLAQSWMWPSGFFQHVFEIVHVYSGFPWWATIVSVVIGLRLTMLPLYLSSSDAAARMARIKPEVNEIMERVKMSTDQLATQEAMLERRQLLKAHNIKTFNLMKPMFSVPIFIGVFGALNGMAAAHVAGLSTGGLFWFHNLAIADPYVGLQTITAVVYTLTFKFFGGETGAANMSPAMKKAFTYLPFLAIPFTMKLPAAVVFYFAINGLFSVIQSNLLKNPALRQRLGLAPMVTPAEQKIIDAKIAGTQPDSISGALRKKYDDIKIEAERRAAQAVREKQAAQQRAIMESKKYVQFGKKKSAK